LGRAIGAAYLVGLVQFDKLGTKWGK
jgi:hypothetical protein